MKHVNSIMVAVDFSDYSLPALRFSAQLANDLGAALHLVNVINQRDIDMWARIAAEYPPFSFEKQIEEQTQERKERFQELLDGIESKKLKVEVKPKIIRGVPFEALLNEIEKKMPDMVVIGVKGRSNMMDTIIGSCAQKMFRRCPVPLLSIRESES